MQCRPSHPHPSQYSLTSFTSCPASANLSPSVQCTTIAWAAAVSSGSSAFAAVTSILSASAALISISVILQFCGVVSLALVRSNSPSRPSLSLLNNTLMPCAVCHFLVKVCRLQCGFTAWGLHGHCALSYSIHRNSFHCPDPWRHFWGIFLWRCSRGRRLRDWRGSGERAHFRHCLISAARMLTLLPLKRFLQLARPPPPLLFSRAAQARLLYVPSLLCPALRLSSALYATQRAAQV